jgi:hypothetical protein
MRKWRVSRRPRAVKLRERAVLDVVIQLIAEKTAFHILSSAAYANRLKMESILTNQLIHTAHLGLAVDSVFSE